MYLEIQKLIIYDDNIFSTDIMEDDLNDDSNMLDDEINNLLLKHERRNTQQATSQVPGQEDSDSDNR